MIIGNEKTGITLFELVTLRRPKGRLRSGQCAFWWQFRLRSCVVARIALKYLLMGSNCGACSNNRINLTPSGAGYPSVRAEERVWILN